MEIKHEQIRNALRVWAAEVGQRRIAALITEKFHKQKMTVPRLGVIERMDGTIDFSAWHNNKQQIFRWIDSDSRTSKKNIQALLPAIEKAMPIFLLARMRSHSSETLREILERKARIDREVEALFGAMIEMSEHIANSGPAGGGVNLH